MKHLGCLNHARTMSIKGAVDIESITEVPDLMSDHEDMDSQNDSARKLAECFCLLDFPDAQLDAFFNLPPLIADGGATQIPAAYVRDTIPRLKVNPREAWDYLLVLEVDRTSKSVARTGRTFPMHDIIWNSQCLAKFPQQKSESSNYVTIPVHSAVGFGTLIKWLYTNDEDALYEHLLSGLKKNENYVLEFCTHVRNLGCINAKIAGVIRSIYEDDDDDDDEEEDEEEDEKNDAHG